MSRDKYLPNAINSNINETAMILEYTQTFNMTQTQFEIDLAFFMLIRGEYGWIGYGWNGCHNQWQYQWNHMLDHSINVCFDSCDCDSSIHPKSSAKNSKY